MMMVFRLLFGGLLLAGLLCFAAYVGTGTVSVSALPNGRPYRIELAHQVNNMTESQLAEEISVIARLAQQNALAGQRLIVANLMSRQGMDPVAVNGYLERDLGLPSMETALAEKADVFATRYEHDED